MPTQLPHTKQPLTAVAAQRLTTFTLKRLRAVGSLNRVHAAAAGTTAADCQKPARAPTVQRAGAHRRGRWCGGRRSRGAPPISAAAGAAARAAGPVVARSVRRQPPREAIPRIRRLREALVVEVAHRLVDRRGQPLALVVEPRARLLRLQLEPRRPCDISSNTTHGNPHRENIAAQFQQLRAGRSTPTERPLGDPPR